MKKSRRNFLKAAGVTALSIGAAPAIKAVAAAESHTAPHAVEIKRKEALKAKRWGMVIDARKLNDEIADKIVKACRYAHNIPDFHHEPDKKKYPDLKPVKFNQEIKWIWKEEFEHAFPDKETDFLAEKFKNLSFLVTCNQCKHPPCVQACPTQATFKREDGIVMMDFHRCIGCRFCMAACPFGSRSFNFRDPRPFIEKINPDYPTRTRGVVEKCDFCAERLAKGELPACVEISEGVITVGDLENPDSEIRKLIDSNFTIKRKQELGTDPSVYYIM